MPRIWLDYCQFLMDQCKITRTRRTFDRALRALPLTQHSRIWPLYIKFIQSYKLPETALRVYRRYLKVSGNVFYQWGGGGGGGWWNYWKHSETNFRIVCSFAIH